MRDFRSTSHLLWLGALAFALCFLACDTLVQWHEVERKSALRGAWADLPVEDAQSPTGYALGRRHLALPYGGTDGYHWIMQTQQMFAQSQLRVRHVDYDNAPDGREVHWASPFRWWMGATAYLHHLVSGRNLLISVELSAPYANPLLFAVVLVLLTPLIAWRFDPVSAAVFALCAVGMRPFACFFATSIPDHHGLATTCGLLGVLFLVAGGGGWIKHMGVAAGSADRFDGWLLDARGARRWFIASGVAAGIGLWVSAASQTLVLVGMGCAAALSVWPARSVKTKPSNIGYDPKLWRIWGLAGGVTSLAAYLIEYFPAGSGWRLEVNHPLFALAWVGAGELLHAWCRRWTEGRWTELPRDLGLLVLAVFAVTVLPLVMVFTHEDTFWVADSYLFRLHKNYIQEFQPLFAALGDQRGLFLILLLLPLLSFLLAGVLLSRKHGNAVVWSWLVLAFVPAAFLFLCSLKQWRWYGVSCGLLLSGFVVLTFACWRMEIFKRFRIWVLVFLLVSAISSPIRFLPGLRSDTAITREDVYQLALRDLSYWLRARTGKEPCVVATGPTLSTFLIYHGGVQGLGTLYWENLHGLRAAGDLFAAKNEEEARRVVSEHAITHVVMVSWDDFLPGYIKLVRGLPLDGAAPDDAFFRQLLKKKCLPAWLRLVPYRFPAKSALKNESVLVFEVVPMQTPEAQTVNLANYLIDMGNAEAAQRLVPDLERADASLPALIAHGRICLEQNQAGSFGLVMAQIERRIGEADTLSLEDRIHLGCLLSCSNDVALAREQLTDCAAHLNEHEVRRLSPVAGYNFVYAASRLGVPPPSSSMRELLFGVLPLKVREELQSSLDWGAAVR